MNIWRAGHDQIERGSTDTWTHHAPTHGALRQVLARDGDEERFLGPQTGALAGYFCSGVPSEYFAELRRPEDRDPRGYVIPRTRPTFPRPPSSSTRF